MSCVSAFCGPAVQYSQLRILLTDPALETVLTFKRKICAISKTTKQPGVRTGWGGGGTAVIRKNSHYIKMM